MIPGYQQSGYRRDDFTGGPLPDGETEPNSEPGVGPLDWTQSADLLATDWMGLTWSDPVVLDDVNSTVPPTDGLYRLWRAEEVPPLEYIGQSANLQSRLKTHRRNRDPTLLFSYAPLDAHDALHKRTEVETDLLGAHWIETGVSPRAQL